MARERHVYPTDEIAHLWAHQTQSDARNPGGNFYFSGPTIYSYGSHFPVAMIATSQKGKHKGEKAILFTNKGYSVTTSKHIGMVRRAIPGDMPIFSVSVPTRYNDEQLKEYEKRIKSALESVVQPRIRKTTKVTRYDAAVALINEANHFAEFFGERKRFSVPDMDGLAASIEADRKSEEKKLARERAAQEKKYAAELAEREAIAATAAQKWIAGGEEYGDNELSLNYREVQALIHSEYAYLKLQPVQAADFNGVEIETSKGARGPVDHARRALAIYRKLREKGETYQRNGHTIHIGHYALDSIDADGNMKAGCHFFKAAEIERFGAILDTLPVQPIPAEPGRAEVHA